MNASALHGLEATFNRLMSLSRQLNADFAADGDDGNGLQSQSAHAMDSLPFGAMLRQLMSESGSLNERLAHFGLADINGLDDGHGQQLNVESLSAITAVSERLPTREITEDQAQSGQSGKCMICMSAYAAGDVVKTLPCIHFYHEKCVDAWFGTGHSTCPECRHSIIHNSLDLELEFN